MDGCLIDLGEDCDKLWAAMKRSGSIKRGKFLAKRRVLSASQEGLSCMYLVSLVFWAEEN